MFILIEVVINIDFLIPLLLCELGYYQNNECTLKQ